MTTTDQTGTKDVTFFQKSATGGKRPKTAFFDRTEMPEILVEGIKDMIEVPDVIAEGVDVEEYFRGKVRVQPLYMDPENNGFSLGSYSFEPGFVMPRHHHDSDQIVMILEGEMRQGNKVLKPGAGFFTPAGGAYGFTVGPAGCRIIEFRDVSNFATVYVEDDPERWQTAAP